MLKTEFRKVYSLLKKSNCYYLKTLLILLTGLAFGCSENKAIEVAGASKLKPIENVGQGSFENYIDSLNVFLIKDGVEEPYWINFMDARFTKWIWYEKDSVHIQLNTGPLGGYSLMIELKGNEFKSQLVKYGCGFRDTLPIKDAFLKMEPFVLEREKLLRGSYYCEAEIIPYLDSLEIKPVIVKGKFEMKLGKPSILERITPFLE